MGTSYRPESPLQGLLKVMMNNRVMAEDERRARAQEELAGRQVKLQELTQLSSLAQMLGEEGQTALAAGDLAGVINAVPRSPQSIMAEMFAQGAPAIDPAQLATIMATGQGLSGAAADKFTANAMQGLSPEEAEVLGLAAASKNLAGMPIGDVMGQQALADLEPDAQRIRALVTAGLAPDARTELMAMLEDKKIETNAALEAWSLRLRERLGVSEIAARDLAMRLQMAELASGKMPDISETLAEVRQNIELLSANDEGMSTPLRQMVLRSISTQLQSIGFPPLTSEAAEEIINPGFYRSNPPLFQTPPKPVDPKVKDAVKNMMPPRSP